MGIPTVADRVAQECLILPSSGVDIGALAHMVEVSIAGRTNRFSACTKALAEYRLGHFASAVDWSQIALSQPKEARSSPAGWWIEPRTYAPLAMAQWQLHQTNGARESLAKAIEVFNTWWEPQDVIDWPDWIFDQALLREASGLIAPEMAPKPDSKTQWP